MRRTRRRRRKIRENKTEVDPNLVARYEEQLERNGYLVLLPFDGKISEAVEVIFDVFYIIDDLGEDKAFGLLRKINPSISEREFDEKFYDLALSSGDPYIEVYRGEVFTQASTRYVREMIKSRILSENIREGRKGTKSRRLNENKKQSFPAFKRQLIKNINRVYVEIDFASENDYIKRRLNDLEDFREPGEPYPTEKEFENMMYRFVVDELVGQVSQETESAFLNTGELEMHIREIMQDLDLQLAEGNTFVIRDVLAEMIYQVWEVIN